MGRLTDGHDPERARAIQQLPLQHELAEDPRIEFATHYVPHDIIGGDYNAITKLSENEYGIMLADVMGHGIGAALYTMHLSQLHGRYSEQLAQPARFAAAVNNELAKVVKTDTAFATAVCAVVDLDRRVLRIASAGGGEFLIVHPDGKYDSLDSPGLPLAIMEDAHYEEAATEIRKGDSLLLFK